MRTRVAALIAVLTVTACELTSTSITQPEDALLVEAWVGFGVEGAFPGVPDQARGWVFLHSVTGSAAAQAAAPEATITMTSESGAATVLVERPIDVCTVSVANEPNPGRCYVADLGPTVTPGSRVTLHVETPDGKVVTGATTIPQDFEILSPVRSGTSCNLPPDTRADVTWTQSPGAWAYTSEMVLRGLGDQLATVDPDFADLEDPLLIFGLAISDSDTTISFPNEYGLFDRFDDDLVTRALVEIQDGMPAGTSARITVSAADRNFVNWERGGNFNPSGPVRVPSLSGDGFGVFGSMVLKTFALTIEEPGPGRVPCSL